MRSHPDESTPIDLSALPQALGEMLMALMQDLRSGRKHMNAHLRWTDAGLLMPISMLQGYGRSTRHFVELLRSHGMLVKSDHQDVLLIKGLGQHFLRRECDHVE